jgi:coproporphyrinogen III oxidase-like Fe-S oxidoreductase
MKRKMMAYAVVPAVLGFGMLGAGVASAHGLFGGMQNLTSDQIVERQSDMFKKQALLLGVSEQVVKEGWSKGQTMKEIAVANGITEEQLKAKMKVAQEEQMKTHLQTLVSKGLITQAQADSRLEVMKTKFASGKGKGRLGMGHMRKFED